MEASPVRRSCVDCGKVFTGTMLRCGPCRPKQKRACSSCGKTFEGRESRCKPCRGSDRICARCGETYRGTRLICGLCRSRTERICEGCGKPYKGNAARCPACRRVKRTCAGCGTEFEGIYLKCDSCRGKKRACEECGETFTGQGLKCSACAQRSWWESLPLEARQAKRARKNNTRRARQAAQTDVTGPVPEKAYEAIRASGPCVYCGDPATTVDHVRPLSQGGWEHESNLVPACGPCNYSKGRRLLTEWRPAERIAYGIEHSPKVAAEYERLTAAA